MLSEYFPNAKVYLSCNAIVNLAHSALSISWSTGLAVSSTFCFICFILAGIHSLKCTQIELGNLTTVFTMCYCPCQLSNGVNAFECVLQSNVNTLGTL